MSASTPTPCRVLIVDDSTLFRSQTQMALQTHPEIEIVGTASNGAMAVEFLKTRTVDVMTLDLEMPVMNGLETLAEIKRLGLKVNVIVFSAHSKAGADTALQALGLGASDFLAKPTMEEGSTKLPYELIREFLLAKVLQFRNVRRPSASVAAAAPSKKEPLRIKPKMIVIASSTGGPNTLEKIFSALRPPLSVPILIAQHMPPIFTASLAERIQKISGIPCAEAVHGENILPGRIYIAPGNFHLTVEGSAAHPKVSLNQDPQRNSVRPAADFLFESAAKIFGSSLLGFVLTGMGADGRDGAVSVKQNNGEIMIQDKESCIVWGMPAAVFEAKAYDRIGTPAEVAKLIQEVAIGQPLNQAAV